MTHFFYGHDKIELGEWRNKKTGDIYIVTGGRINTTNELNGQAMVEYERKYKDEIVSDDVDFPFVREVSEFLEKFEKIENE